MKISSALPIRLVVVSWPALRMKMQFCSSSVSVSCAALVLAVDQPRQHILLGIARAAAALVDQALQIGGEVAHRIVAERQLLRRQHRLERAEDRERPAAQRAALGMRHAEQVADDLDRNRGGEILDQVGAALRAPSRRAAGRPARPAPPPSRRCTRFDSAIWIARRTCVCSGGSLNTRLVVWCS